MNSEKGLVIIYTGEGKGKTTAALGLVLRAVGYKKKCLIIQFGKAWFTGELVGIKKLSPLVKIIQGGKGFLSVFRARDVQQDPTRSNQGNGVRWPDAQGWDIFMGSGGASHLQHGTRPHASLSGCLYPLCRQGFIDLEGQAS